MSTRVRVLGLVVLAAVAAVAAVLVLTDGPSRTTDQEVRAIAGQLRCPTCNGESVAQSDAPMARSMRSEAAAQLRAGRSPDQVLDFFRSRYGDDVVLSPARRGIGWLLWLVPPLALAAGLGLVLVGRRGGGGFPGEPGKPSLLGRSFGREVTVSPGRSGAGGDPAPSSAAPARLGARTLAATAVVAVAVGAAIPVLAARHGDETGTPASDASPVASDEDPTVVAQRLDDAERYDEAVAAWRRARRAHPESDTVRARLAFDLLRSGHAERVPPLVAPLVRGDGDQHDFALLVLGLAQRDLGRPAADRTLRAFLRAAPDHPAAAQVRRLLDQ